MHTTPSCAHTPCCHVHTHHVMCVHTMSSCAHTPYCNAHTTPSCVHTPCHVHAHHAIMCMHTTPLCACTPHHQVHTTPSCACTPHHVHAHYVVMCMHTTLCTPCHGVHFSQISLQSHVTTHLSQSEGSIPSNLSDLVRNCEISPKIFPPFKEQSCYNSSAKKVKMLKMKVRNLV